MGNTDPSVAAWNDPACIALMKTQNSLYFITNGSSMVGFTFLAVAMSLQLLKMKRDWFFIFVASFCAVIYAFQFFAFDCKYLFTDATSWTIEYNNFMTVVAYMFSPLQIVGHYLLLAAYFKYSMSMQTAFMSPSAEKQKKLCQRRVIIYS